LHPPYGMSRRACPVGVRQAYQGGKAHRLPPFPQPGHTPAVPDYRRNRGPRGIFLLTGEPARAPLGLLVTGIDVLRGAIG
jgi:hypothetical protein